MKPSILYVEDEAETREMIGDILAEQYPRFSLLMAGDGAEGLALFREHRPQVVVTDIRMPVMDGLAMATEIRAIDAEVPLIALTAFSDTSFLVRAIELGFSHYVFKPLNIKMLIAAIGKSVEVSELKQQVRAQNERLRESEERLQATFDQAAVGIAHLALDGSFLRVNARYCEIIGCSADHHAVDLYDFTHPDDIHMCREHHDLMLDGKLRSYALEKRYVHDDGSIVWAALTISMVLDSRGAQSFMVAIIDDITERKELEANIAELNAALAARAAELQTANRDLKAFNHTVAHDLRQPLNVISGYCQMIKQFCGQALTQECRDFLDEAYHGTLRMNKLVTVLLQFSEAAQADLKHEQVDLSALAEDVADELRKGAPEREVTFTIAPGLTVEGDQHLLRVVLANLFGNAWKYTAERGNAASIEFGRTVHGGKSTFFVRDNGIGFRPEEAKDMFVPFRRLPSGERVGGFGIGLGTVQRVVSRHGGEIWAEGEPGKGAVFYFTLP